MENRIQGTTRLLGLIGYPSKHSKSPQMHNKSFEALGLDYVYLAFEVQDGHIKEALDSLKTLNAIGGNITMPHKTKIVEYLDDISPDAKIIGSINTIKIDENKKITGYNTDGKGLVKALQENDVKFKGKKVVIAGAGGAARAVATQLAYDGVVEIVLFNRTLEKAKIITDNINVNITSCKATAKYMNEADLVNEIKDAAVLINCTSLGMKSTIDQSIISSPAQLPKDIFIADIIYDPDQTRLLKIAKEAGCRYMNGLMMLIWQGAISFKIWTGVDMPVDLIKNEIFNK
ncbi:MAG: shikimate dehydrogenase [Tissierellia bacterium]|nr:shikimate dehydrogenase [Tissierellia bacterium]